MNNVYNNGKEIFHKRDDMCYDNKIMVNAALSECALPQVPSPPVCLNITDNDKTKAAASPSSAAGAMFNLRKRLRTRYLTDAFIVVVVFSATLLIELGTIPHTKLGFICQDPNISYPFREDTISTATLLVGCLLGPLVVIILVEFIRVQSITRIRIGEVWTYYKECSVGASLVLLITEIIKVLVGEHRPHFFDSCRPDTNATCVPGQFILDFTCTNPQLSNYFKSDISRSFPSGHTSISIFVALYCSYLIQRRIPRDSVSQLTKPFLISVCLTWGLVCSLSRITDRRHHWWDVLAGAFLAVCGIFYIAMFQRIEENRQNPLVRSDTSVTTLIDVKNKDATSVII